MEGQGMKPGTQAKRDFFSQNWVFDAASFAVPSRTWENDDCSFFVRGLPPEMTDLDMYHLFAPFGPIFPWGASAVLDKVSGSCTGSGFINYMDQEASQKAIDVLDQFPMGDGGCLIVQRKRSQNPGLINQGGQERHQARFDIQFVSALTGDILAELSQELPFVVSIEELGEQTRLPIWEYTLVVHTTSFEGPNFAITRDMASEGIVVVQMTKNPCTPINGYQPDNSGTRRWYREFLEFSQTAPLCHPKIDGIAQKFGKTFFHGVDVRVLVALILQAEATLCRQRHSTLVKRY